MAKKAIHLTAKGLQKIKDELQYLTEVRRKELTEYMGSAIADGDLRESAAYDEARMLQSQNEARIADLEDIVHRAIIVEAAEGASSVRLGSMVQVKDESNGDVLNFELVGTHEADVLENRISDESPLGAELMDKEAGVTVTVNVGKNSFNYTLLNVAAE